VPAVLLLIGNGLDLLRDFGQKRHIEVIIVALLLLFVPPLFYTIGHALTTPYALLQMQEIKPILQHIQSHRQPSDFIYLNYTSQPAFKFYASNYGISEGDYLVGENTKTMLSHTCPTSRSCALITDYGLCFLRLRSALPILSNLTISSKKWIKSASVWMNCRQRARWDSCTI
jgi:hypothetical protein